MLYRYAEGSGTDAKFAKVNDIKFLSATTLICSDSKNHCLRLFNLTESMAETSTYAGTCTTGGTTDGHRLRSALFHLQRFVEVNNYNSTMFVLDSSQSLRMIDFETDEVATVIQFSTYTNNILLSGSSLLYVTFNEKVAEFNLNSEEYNWIAGESKVGKATGSFDLTKFDNARGLLLLSLEGKTLLLVADKGNNR